MTAQTGRQNAQNAFLDDSAPCETCGTRFLRRRAWQKYCSDRCRKDSFKKPGAEKAPAGVRYVLEAHANGSIQTFRVLEVHPSGAAHPVGRASEHLASVLSSASAELDGTLVLPLVLVKS